MTPIMMHILLRMGDVKVVLLLLMAVHNVWLLMESLDVQHAAQLGSNFLEQLVVIPPMMNILIQTMVVLPVWLLF